MNQRNQPCWCGSQKKWKKCHYPQTNPSASGKLAEEYFKKYRILLKTPEQIVGIKRACKLAAHILDATGKMAKAGVTTHELNEYANKLHKDAGAIPATLGYGTPPYPKSICTSINEIVCHGIPDNTTLKEGDILNIDVSPILDGYYGDCSKMIVIGKTTEERQRVVDTAYQCLMRAIAILEPGLPICEIGEAIESYAHSQKCSVVHQFVAHGVGLHFHENPQILHCRNNQRLPLAPGMTFTIEPMINAGSPDTVIDPKDQWTVRTVDGKPSAQWEHTLLITEDGHEILTLPD